MEEELREGTGNDLKQELSHVSHIEIDSLGPCKFSRFDLEKVIEICGRVVQCKN